MDTVLVNCTNIEPLRGLLKRIEIFNKLVTDVDENMLIAFEDIPFFDATGLPYDQNSDPWESITPELQATISGLLNSSVN